MPRQLGSATHQINVSDEYERLATEDEEAAIFLNQHGKYRHAMYFLIQSMEKYVRSKIFTLVNPNKEYFRERNRNHSLDDALQFLLEIVTNDDIVQSQIKNQLYTNVLGNIQFNHLHNNLRYSWYSAKFDSFSVLNVSKSDVDIVFERLNSLKAFLRDIHRLM